MATTPVPHTSRGQNEHGEPAARDVLAHLGFGPAFPGVLTTPDTTTPMADTTERTEQSLLVSLSIARWIGVLLEARYGSAQVKFFWHDDPAGLPVLAIEDDPWDEHSWEQPRLIYPDEQGRYALADYWVALTDEQAADWKNNHTDALRELAATEPDPNVSTVITDYLLLGHAPREEDPDHHIRGIRRALADHAESRITDPIVDVITDQDSESGLGVAVFLNGRPVATDRHITLGAGTHTASPDRDAIYEAIMQAGNVLTPPAAELVRELLEPRLPAPTSSWPSFE